MKTINCIIVDDEPLAAKVIENYVKNIDFLNLVAICNNAVEAYNCVNSNKIDLAFLDIQMPQITGLEFIKMFITPPQIILTTAYREFALESYELEVIDYLLKPVAFDRFLKAVNKVSKSLDIPEIKLDQKIVTEENINFQNPYIFVKADKMMVKIYLNEIKYIEALKDYVQVVTTKDKIITYLSLNYLVERLPKDQFCRVHRSFIISIDKIESYTGTDIIIAKQLIPIGRHYKNSLMGILNSKNNLLK